MTNNIEFLDLGLQPLANYYLKKSQINKKQKKYRLIVCFNKKNYLVSIDEIELLTSIDFFSQLPDKKEDKLESMIYISDWDFEFERP